MGAWLQGALGPQLPLFLPANRIDACVAPVQQSGDAEKKCVFSAFPAASSLTQFQRTKTSGMKFRTSGGARQLRG